MTLEEKVLRIIRDHGPIKGTEIVVRLTQEFGLKTWEESSDAWFEDKDWLPKLLETLVERRQLIEVEYVIETEEEEDDEKYVLRRAKSIFFPACAEVRLRGAY
jgi:hypothetical protein